tara:strand:- start:114 stop:713 length:600 start_codon:yes stop_codon:yes gene_type:complete
MKTFITVLVLILSLQSWTKAEDISDFEIEGMSVGDSLLDYLPKNKILSKINHSSSYWYPNDAFVSIGTMSEAARYELYEDVGIILKPNDKKFIIYALEGTFYYGDKIKKCHKKQKEISSDLKEMFNSTNYKLNEFEVKYQRDKSGKSKVKYVDFLFEDTSAVRVICYNMSKELNDKGNDDSLYTVINSSEFMTWLNNNM